VGACDSVYPTNPSLGDLVEKLNGMRGRSVHAHPLRPGLRAVGGIGKVLERALGVRLDRLAAFVPVGGADLAVFIGELEGLDETDRLVDRAANWEVVDRDLPNRRKSCVGQLSDENGPGNP
jgi:hypothetical protein